MSFLVYVVAAVLGLAALAALACVTGLSCMVLGGSVCRVCSLAGLGRGHHHAHHH